MRKELLAILDRARESKGEIDALLKENPIEVHYILDRYVGGWLTYEEAKEQLEKYDV